MAAAAAAAAADVATSTPSTAATSTPSAAAPTTTPSACAAAGPSRVAVHVVRLPPGADLLDALQQYVAAARLRAAFVVTCVGSLTHATLRLANARGATHYDGHFEIVSLVGTFAPAAAVEDGGGGGGGAHLHLSFADGDGVVRGGHVLPGCRVYTTAEVVVGEATDVAFSRPVDAATTWDELLPVMRA